MALCPNCFREQNSAGPCPVCGYDGSGAERKHPQALRPGAILNGRYIVGRVLGQGGFGITYLALDNQTKSRVAIKEYYPAELAGRTMDGCSVAIHSEERAETFAYGKAQFLEEARTLARFLDNPYVVRIHNYFEENGTGYFTMEYVEGPGLDKYMAPFGGRLGVQEAKHLLLPLMEAMDEVHDKGIVHRDVAPDNIIVTRDGRVKLIDFGAARYSTGEKSKSLDVILKHGFAPYEQYMRRGRQGPWTDVYAMAATFYYAITGKVPPDATERKDEDTLIPPSTLGVPIDERSEEALLKALEVSAVDRFQRMGDFAAALRGEAVPAREQRPAPQQAQQSVPKPVPAMQNAAPVETVLVEAAGKQEAAKKKSRLPLIMGVACAAALALVLVFARPGGKEALPTVTPPPAEEPVEPTPEPTASPEPEPIGAEKLKHLWFDNDYAVGVRYDGTVFSVGEAFAGVSKWTDLCDLRAVHSQWSITYGYLLADLVGLQSDGTIKALHNDNSSEITGWTDIAALGGSSSCWVGLKSDGTMVITGPDSNLFAVSDWKDVVSFSMYGGSDYGRVVGIRSDGTVVATGKNNHKTCEVSTWSDVASVYLDADYTLGLRKDGAVYDTSERISDWKGIDSLYFCRGCVFGLTSTGTVKYKDFHSVSNSRDFENVKDWSDITSLIASYGFMTCEGVAGLRKDGTVVYAGDNSIIKDTVSTWAGVKKLFFNGDCLVGLCFDGSVLFAGNDEFNQKSVLENWSNIVEVFPAYNYILGLRSDGTFVLAGTGVELAYFTSDLSWTIDELNAAAGLNRP